MLPFVRSLARQPAAAATSCEPPEEINRRREEGGASSNGNEFKHVRKTQVAPPSSLPPVDLSLRLLLLRDLPCPTAVISSGILSRVARLFR
jgi:hypothetical protein